MNSMSVYLYEFLYVYELTEYLLSDISESFYYDGVLDV